MSDKTVRVLKQIDAAIKCIEHDYANPFNADVLLAAKCRIEELERAVLAASEKEQPLRNLMEVKRTSDQSVELAFMSCNAASEFYSTAIAAAGNHKVEGE